MVARALILFYVAVILAAVVNSKANASDAAAPIPKAPPVTIIDLFLNIPNLSSLYSF